MGRVATESQMNSYKRYMQKFDSFNVRFPKEDGKSKKKDYIRHAKEKHNVSLNGLILKLLEEDYKKNGSDA